MSQEVTARTLSEYNNLVRGLNCRWCGGKLDESIERYDHAGGFYVDGFAERQWLFKHCSKCDYDWSLQKLLGRLRK